MSVDIVGINYLAVVVATVVNFAFGALWYSPVLWAKPWMAATGITAEEAPANSRAAMMGYGFAALTHLVVAMALAFVVQLTGASTVAHGLVLGLITGAGFAATAMGPNFVFEQKSPKLYLIDAGYPVVGYLIMAIIITLWQ